MKRLHVISIVIIIVACFGQGLALGQSEQDGYRLNREAQEIEKKAQSRSDLEKAIKKYEDALSIFEKVKSEKGKGVALNNIGLVYKSLGQYSKALEYYEKSLPIRQKIGDVAGEGTTLNNIGLVYKSLGQYTKALEYYEKSLPIRQKIGDVQGEGVTLGNIGLVYDNLGQYTKALEYYEKSLPIFRKIGDVKGEGTTLNNIGGVYKDLGQYTKALEYYEKSLEIMKKIGDVKGEGVTLNNIGGLYFRLGQYTRALEYYEKSLPIRQKIGDVKGEGVTLTGIGVVYKSLGQYTKALEYYEKSLPIRQKIGDVKGEGTTLNNIGGVYKDLGQYAKALEYYEKSLPIRQKIGDVKGEGVTLGNIGGVYNDLGQYSKALEYYEKSLPIRQKIGDVAGEGVTLSNIGAVYDSLGQYSKALEYYEKSLPIFRKIGDVKGEGVTLGNIGAVYAQLRRYDDAIKLTNQYLEIEKKIGVPTKGTTDLLANYYLDAGDLVKAEPLIKETGYNSTLGRLALLRSDYLSAINYYTKDAAWAEKTGNSNSLFRSYTGLGKAYEGSRNYPEAGKYYEKAVKVTEDIRTGVSPAERRNFFEVKNNGFQRSDPAKGLTRIRMKMNNPEGSIAPGELTKARSFSDHLSLTNASAATGLPAKLQEEEQSLVNQLAAVKKDLEKTDREKFSDKYNNLKKASKETEDNLNAFVERLRKQYPAYAAVKYPKPVSLNDAALNPGEYAVIYDVSSQGVAVRLCADKQVKKSFFVELKKEDLDKDVSRFRDPIQKLQFDKFKVELSKSLYSLLFRDILSDVPKGTPLIIIPDGVLATLPFEALVLEGTPMWDKGIKDHPYPEGLTYLVDRHPISYYQSLTALTLARTFGEKESRTNKMLVLADPVFSNQDSRAQQASRTKMAESEKKFNMDLMKAIEEDDEISISLKRLPRTLLLAEGLKNIYGPDCLALTGLKANKSDFMLKIAPNLDTYRNVVFATHGVMSTKIPGLMEPFLALTMAPPGTDGFLKMSDILSLKMNADVVALTACQTGLGKDLSGEGVMSMGRAFQYAGAKSVLMTLWEVEEASAIKLTEKFFQYRKDGKSKLEALQTARDDIKKEGYKHPYFWSGFILVGETM